MTYYEIWSIVVAAIGSVATFAAVVVALWQSKFAVAKKLKLSYTETVRLIQHIPSGNFEKFNHRFMQVSVANIGNRKITITGWCIYISKKFQLQIVCLDKNIFPLALDLEECKNLETHLLGLKKAIISNAIEIERNINKRIKICVYDSTGKKYFVKAKRTYKELAEMADEELVLKIE